MHKIAALLLLISLIIVVIISILWEDKKADITPLPIENTTQILHSKNVQKQNDTKFTQEKKQTDLPEVKRPAQETNVFTLSDTKAQSHAITISDEKVTFQQNDKPIVIVNFFATWCPPCIGEIPYLNDLQKKYQPELFIAGILTHDSIDKLALEIFMTKHKINYFISYTADNDAFANTLANKLNLSENFSIPLTVMYVEGEYFTHYEGAVPIEMIEYDIQQAKNQLKSR